jgi:hypothetical protein
MDQGEARQGFAVLQEQIAVFRRKALFGKRKVVPGINALNGERSRAGPGRREPQRGFARKSAHAAAPEEVFRAYHFAVERPGYQRLRFNFAGFRLGDGDVVHVQSAPERTFVVGFGLLEIG